MVPSTVGDVVATVAGVVVVGSGTRVVILLVVVVVVGPGEGMSVVDGGEVGDKDMSPWKTRWAVVVVE
jgi:hypothetical protein